MKHQRLYISADIEGVAGVTSKDQTRPEGFEYRQAREWMTNEVNAACQAAFDCGINEIIVSDSHGNAQNLLPDKLLPEVQLIRGWPRPLGMMEGVDIGPYDAALLLGYHTGATDRRGVLAHTLSGLGMSGVTLNGQPASETVISAAIAGHFGVPIAMVSGDDAYTEHAREMLGDIEVATVKWSYGTTSMRTLSPEKSRNAIAERVSAALDRVDDLSVFALKTPITVEVCCVQRRAAELLDYLPLFERIDARTVRFVAEDMPDVSRTLKFITTCGALNIGLLS